MVIVALQVDNLEIWVSNIIVSLIKTLFRTDLNESDILQSVRNLLLIQITVFSPPSPVHPTMLAFLGISASIPQLTTWQ